MSNGIAFLTVSVTIMVDLTIQGIRKNTQVSDAECFKQKTKGFEIIHKVIRSDAQCRGSNRWYLQDSLQSIRLPQTFYRQCKR